MLLLTFCSNSLRPTTTTLRFWYSFSLDKLKKVLWSQHRTPVLFFSVSFFPQSKLLNCPPKKDKFKSNTHSHCQFVYFHTNTFNKNFVSSRLKFSFFKKVSNFSSSNKYSEPNTAPTSPLFQSSITCCS